MSAGDQYNVPWLYTPYVPLATTPVVLDPEGYRPWSEIDNPYSTERLREAAAYLNLFDIEGLDYTEDETVTVVGTSRYWGRGHKPEPRADWRKEGF